MSLLSFLVPALPSSRAPRSASPAVREASPWDLFPNVVEPEQVMDLMRAEFGVDPIFDYQTPIDYVVGDSRFY